jgi:hypothetical protein
MPGDTDSQLLKSDSFNLSLAIPGMSRFTQRHLDPGSRLGEILFDLIMVLTVTLTAGLTVMFLAGLCFVPTGGTAISHFFAAISRTAHL